MTKHLYPPLFSSTQKDHCHLISLSMVLHWILTCICQLSVLMPPRSWKRLHLWSSALCLIHLVVGHPIQPEGRHQDKLKQFFYIILYSYMKISNTTSSLPFAILWRMHAWVAELVVTRGWCSSASSSIFKFLQKIKPPLYPLTLMGDESEVHLAQ